MFDQTHVNNVSNQFNDKKLHPATFPQKLAEFFIKIYSNENDLVCDPFMGSGTTGLATNELNRLFLGIELKEEYIELSKIELKEY